MDNWIEDAPIAQDGTPQNTRCGLENAHYKFTASLVKRGVYHDSFTALKRVLDAIDLGFLNRDLAVKWATEKCGWPEAYLLRHGKLMQVPADQSEVRSYWKKLPGRLLTEAEKRLRDKDCDRLRALYPDGYDIAKGISRR